MSALRPCPKCGAKPRRNRIWHDKSCPERFTAALNRGDDAAERSEGK